MKLFLKLAPSYFDYMSKCFFHSQPSCLVKILGAFKIITFDSSEMKKTKRYFIVMENLNLGLENTEDLVRYDLKGSENKRYVMKENKIGKVLLDTNFKLDFNSRPIPLNFKI